MLQFCCKFTALSVCQKLSKYDAVWQSYQRRRLFFFLPRAKDELLSSLPLLSLLTLSSPPYPPFPSPRPFPLEAGPLNTARGLGERCELPNAPADKRFGAYLNQKEQLWWQQFFVDFDTNKCDFLHKNKHNTRGKGNEGKGFPESTNSFIHFRRTLIWNFF